MVSRCLGKGGTQMNSITFVLRTDLEPRVSRRSCDVEGFTAASWFPLSDVTLWLKYDKPDLSGRKRWFRIRRWIFIHGRRHMRKTGRGIAPSTTLFDRVLHQTPWCKILFKKRYQSTEQVLFICLLPDRHLTGDLWTIWDTDPETNLKSMVVIDPTQAGTAISWLTTSAHWIFRKVRFLLVEVLYKASVLLRNVVGVVMATWRSLVH